MLNTRFLFFDGRSKIIGGRRKMKRKIVGILVTTLLIATAILPVIGTEDVSNINENEYDLVEFSSIVHNELDLAIDSSGSDEICSVNDPYVIYEGLHWQLTITVRWDPPNPEKPICLWVDTVTLPAGATFPECVCGYGEVSGVLDWTPSIGQAGTYQIVFYVGENCYEPIGYFTVTVIVYPYTPEPQDTYEIYEGQDWHLIVTVRWVPPQEKLICLWVDTATLPYGATFVPECHCDYGQVTSDLYWTPYVGQAGVYIITFYAGEICGEYVFPFSIRVIVYPIDTIPPTVTKVFPEVGAIFTDPDIIATGYVTDNVGVTYFGYTHEWAEGATGSSWPIEDPTEYYPFEIPILLREGWNIIKIEAGDAASNYGYDNETVYLKGPCDKNPKITDGSGNTKFYGVFVGCSHKGTNSELRGSDNDAEAMYNTLKGKTGWHTDRMKKFTGNNAKKNDIKTAIDEIKGKIKPGEEFFFYFSDHGGNFTPDTNGDEPDGKDETIHVIDGAITDDELTEWLSNFSKCVTISVKLDACHSGGFKDGTKDLQHATNANGEEYGPNKIAIEAACGADQTTSERDYKWNDKNGDGVATPDELGDSLGIVWIDSNHNGKWDPGEQRWHWHDKNKDGKVDAGEKLDWNDPTVIAMGDFTKKNLEGLATKTLLDTDGYTNADRNMDGITTTKELYEYSINELYEEFAGDNDGDGLVDEDGYEFEEVGGQIIRLYIDNDGDGLIDEDPAPPASAFWSNEGPDTPPLLSGPSKGKTGETYVYMISTDDPEEDDVYYWFDWGDGTNTGWLGQYGSGDECSASHIWDRKGDYVIKVKARDRCFAESDWTTLEVSMPKNKPYLDIFLLRFFGNYPHMCPLLQHLLGL